MYALGPIMGRTYQMRLERDGAAFDVVMTAVAPPASQRTLRPTRAPGTDPDTLAAEVEAFRTELARTTLQPSKRPLKPLAKSSPRKELLRTKADSDAVRDQELYDELAGLQKEKPTTIDRLDAQRTKAGDPTIVDSPELYQKLEMTRMAKVLDVRMNAISGAEFEDLNPALGEYFGGIQDGVLVIRVGPESPAASAGLQPGDVVKTINGEDVATIASLRERVANTSGTITFGVIRKGRLSTVTLRKEE
jgi:C-terminal processing protease CtpA/Prc